MTSSLNLPITLLINQLNTKKGSTITFDELKTELLKTTSVTVDTKPVTEQVTEPQTAEQTAEQVTEPQTAEQVTEPQTAEQVTEPQTAEQVTEPQTAEQVYHLQLKDDDNLCLIYYTNLPSDSTNSELENSCRSIIIEKSTLKPVVSQGNKILYNNDTLDFLADKDWSHVTVQRCFEGTLLVVFNYNDKWYVTTRRCLDAQDSKWVMGNSYYDMFVDAMSGVFTFDELNKDYCYHFVLIHSKNKNIVSYTWLGKDYAELLHVMTTEKYTLNEVHHTINSMVRFVEEESFESLFELQQELARQNDLDVKYQRVTTEGYILRYYYGEIHNSPFVNLKLQTEIYETIMRLKPNNSNINQCFLELYQIDKLADFLPFFTRYGGEVVRRINNSMKNVAKEVLDLYHATRNKKNDELYNSLTNVYKKCIYELHGQYIKNRRQDFTDGVDTKSMETTRAINVFDVYNYLKALPPKDLRQLYFDRMSLLENPKITCLNKNCINTMTQCAIMFKPSNDKSKNNKKK